MTTSLTGFSGIFFQECLDMLSGLSAVQSWLGVASSGAARERMHLSQIDPQTGEFDEAAITALRPYIVLSGQPFGYRPEAVGPVRQGRGVITLCFTASVPSALKADHQEALIAFWNSTDAILDAIDAIEEGSGQFQASTITAFFPIRNPRTQRTTQGDYFYRYVELETA